MGKSARRTKAALALSKSVAELCLVDTFHMAELVVAMCEIAVGLVALLSEEVEAQLCLPEIWCGGQLITGVSKAAGSAKMTISLREHSAHASFAESCLHSGGQSLTAII
jgi:hypothetical protein